MLMLSDRDRDERIVGPYRNDSLQSSGMNHRRLFLHACSGTRGGVGTRATTNYKRIVSKDVGPESKLKNCGRPFAMFSHK